jgi:hypothetical protein
MPRDMLKYSFKILLNISLLLSWKNRIAAVDAKGHRQSLAAETIPQLKKRHKKKEIDCFRRW